MTGTKKNGQVQESGARKTAERVLAELCERNLEQVLTKVAEDYHVTPLEICGFGGQQPIPQARAEVWGYLVSGPAQGGPGWSKHRVAAAWDVDDSTVSKLLIARKRTKKKTKGAKP